MVPCYPTDRKDRVVWSIILCSEKPAARAALGSIGKIQCHISFHINTQFNVKSNIAEPTFCDSMLTVETSNVVEFS